MPPSATAFLGAAAGVAAAVTCLKSKPKSKQGAVAGSTKMRKATRGQSLLTDVKLKVAAPLDSGFAPYALAKKNYLAACEGARGVCAGYTRTLYVAILRQNGLCNRLEFPVFPSSDSRFNDSLLYAYFTIMFAICQKGGFKVMLCGPSDICAEIKAEFSLTGSAAFPVDLMTQVYDKEFEVVRVAKNQLPDHKEDFEKVGLDVTGNRLSFDLGKSDFKVVACIDGKPTYHSESEWDIYQTDPNYHYDIVLGGCQGRAAAISCCFWLTACVMPCCSRDEKGGQDAAPCRLCWWRLRRCADQERLRLERLFPARQSRGLQTRLPALLQESCQGCFCNFSAVSVNCVCPTCGCIDLLWLRQAFGNVPLKVMNDGEVTAVAGVQMMEQQTPGCTKGKGTFGISMGSNCGAGYMLPTGDDGVPRHAGWLNELWTAPVDFSPDAWECFFTAQVS
eukprot:COSAG05_NODE_2693_length_2765_cov_2.085896_2_plen_448_part_00